jgi:predicted dehydrogenase
VAGVVIEAVASRDLDRARAFADRYEIQRSYGAYESLLADADVDAVYVATPNSLHVHWSQHALRAGKHVLCEKPLAATSHEAEELFSIARDRMRVLTEAMHYRYHPDVKRAVATLRSGSLGRPMTVQVDISAPSPTLHDIRLQQSLGGGVLADLGCYTSDLVIWLSEDPCPCIEWVRSVTGATKVDIEFDAQLRCRSGLCARLHCDMTAREFSCRATIITDTHEVVIENPFLPAVQNGSRKQLFAVRVDGHHQTYDDNLTSYVHQLRAFRNHVIMGTTAPDSEALSIARARLISNLAQEMQRQRLPLGPAWPVEPEIDVTACLPGQHAEIGAREGGNM